MTWVAAAETKNYLLRDPFLDWLHHYHENRGRSCAQYAEVVNFRLAALGPRWTSSTAPCPPDARTSSVKPLSTFLASQALEFKEHVLTFLYRTHGENVRDAGRSLPRTLELLKNATPIIHGAYVVSQKTKTFGFPDLIVRADWLSKLVDELPVAVAEDVQEPPRHHRVVGLQYSRLALRSDGVHLKNAGSLGARKGQLYLLARALGEMQSYDPGMAYLLGRGSRFTRGGVEQRTENCFGRYGTMDFRPGHLDACYPKKSDEAVQWINRLRTEGFLWDPLQQTGPKEMLPNMCNAHDFPWHEVKKLIATRRRDITQMWSCGSKERDRALAAGVNAWDDPLFSAALIGIRSEPRRSIFEQVLRVNRSPEHLFLPRRLVSPEFLETPPLEYFVDFETLQEGIFDPKANFPGSTLVSSSFIFMIGVGYLRPAPRVQTRAQKKVTSSRRWVFRTFTAEDLTAVAQDRVCNAFVTYLRTTSARYGVPAAAAKLRHWSPAEPSLWKKVRPADDLPWSDLLDVFKRERVAIQGCFGYSLKSVATALREAGAIRTSWTAECHDGVEAMLGALSAYARCELRRIPCSRTTSLELAEITKYNEVDCQVLMEIMTYFREQNRG